MTATSNQALGEEAATQAIFDHEIKGHFPAAHPTKMFGDPKTLHGPMR